MCGIINYTASSKRRMTSMAVLLEMKQELAVQALADQQR